MDHLEFTVRHLSWTGWLGVSTAAILIFCLANVVYNIFLHPLRRFPGPFWHRATRWAWVYRVTRGTMPFDVLAMHEMYGPVVRIAPNELVFSSAQAWKDIYGHRFSGTLRELPKYHRFYKAWDSQPASIVTATGEQHAMLRRHLAHGFSDKGMREQEPLVMKYVDLLLKKLKEHQPRGAINIANWYNYTTFDIIGDLAFGDPFYCLENAEFHPWVKLIFQQPKENVKVISLRLLGFTRLALLVLYLTARSSLTHIKKTREKLLRRMQLGVGRPDLIDGLIKKKEEEGCPPISEYLSFAVRALTWEQNIDMGVLHFTATTLIVAGSETTATLLCGVTYLLLKHPDILARVTEEVRTTFKSEDEITLISVGTLSYMLACLNETLRCYPPVPIGLPRLVPKGGLTLAGHFVPANTVVSVYQYACTHYSANWNLPFEYHPERFLGDERFVSDKTDAMQPFSVGPRSCIGRNLAYAEMRLILARVLFNFDMRLADDSQRWMEDQKVYSLWRKDPLNVHLTPVTCGDTMATSTEAQAE